VLVHRTDPVYGLTTIHGSLRTFLAEPVPTKAGADAREASLAFGLMALGKFILRLPSEILEDELPRLKSTLVPVSLYSWNRACPHVFVLQPFLDAKSPVVVREAAALVMIAAQNVLRDEAHLFALLDGLPDEKKNLLTYLFDKNGVRGPARAAEPDAANKLEKEMRRLDGRTSTPMRARVLN
jgi:CLIP-associating protein 1/2